ncbi:helix-turn-helix domain-containing protein [Vulcanisaeta distributa]|uniref:helix-turn-helix domain-containing protein n=1 Tax=Vulcanisaeta distributa TaxID=164451 RepID=UPI0011E4F570|nr:helix-turn-helix domain-containing protein [Vulcanisaeta distributa]
MFDAIMKYVNDYESVVIAITGGVRAFSAVSPLVTAMLRMAINKEVRLFVVSENLVDYLDLTETLRVFNVVELSEGLINVLRALHEVEGSGGCVRVDEVAERLGKDSSTVRRQLYELEDKGLVTGSDGLRRRCFSLTCPACEISKENLKQAPARYWRGSMLACRAVGRRSNRIYEHHPPLWASFRWL